MNLGKVFIGRCLKSEFADAGEAATVPQVFLVVTISSLKVASFWALFGFLTLFGILASN